jgi:5'-nucleotidase
MVPSSGVTYAVDMSNPAGSRVSDIRFNGKILGMAAKYRVVVNNYLASGGDGISAFTGGTDITDKGIIDLDALVAWIAPGRTPPQSDRVHLIGAH